MKGRKIETFMRLAGQEIAERIEAGTPRKRELGARLLLSEVLEYVIDGLGVIPSVNGTPIEEADKVTYQSRNGADALEMIDGLADVAYTMYWNALAFGIPLEQAFEMVCDNNLQKFVRLPGWENGERELAKDEWECGQGILWPSDVVKVKVLKVGEEYYAAGLDPGGKVRKPSSYVPVDLSALL